MKYPEHEKLKAIQVESQAIGEFLENNGKGYMLAFYPEDSYHLLPVHISINNLLAEYFGIDLIKLEEEKTTMLNELREMNT